MRVLMNQSNAIFSLFNDLLGCSSVDLNSNGSDRASSYSSPFCNRRILVPFF
jgi:hypothetical protein